MMNIYAQAGLAVAYSRISKQAGIFRVHNTFHTCFHRVAGNLQLVDSFVL